MAERRQLQSDNREGGAYGFSPDQDVDFFSSGCKTFDLNLGGGWAERRPSNIIGDSASGKTLLAVEAGVNFIRKYPKGKVRYREREAAFSNYYITNKLGMPLTGFDFSDKDHPSETIEDLYEELEFRVDKAKSPELMIVDSLDAFTTRKELARKIDKEQQPGEKAKQMSALFRRINWAMAEKHITLMIISQTRAKIGVVYGKKWDRSGGNALQFYSSQVVVLKVIDKIKKAYRGVDHTTGVWVHAYMDKNKVGAAYNAVDFPIIFGYGIDDKMGCVKYLKQHKIKRTGDESLKRLHMMVEKAWVEKEEALTPKAKKYA